MFLPQQRLNPNSLVSVEFDFHILTSTVFDSIDIGGRACPLCQYM